MTPMVPIEAGVVRRQQCGEARAGGGGGREQAGGDERISGSVVYYTVLHGNAVRKKCVTKRGEKLFFHYNGECTYCTEVGLV